MTNSIYIYELGKTIRQLKSELVDMESKPAIKAYKAKQRMLKRCIDERYALKKGRLANPEPDDDFYI